MFCTWRCVPLGCRCCRQLQRNPALIQKWTPGGPKMTPKCLQIDPGSARMTPHRVPEVSGTSPRVANGPRRADAGAPGGTFPERLRDPPGRLSEINLMPSSSLPFPALRLSSKNTPKADFPLSMSLGGSARSYVFFRVGAISAVPSFVLSLRVVEKSSRNDPGIDAKMTSGWSGRLLKS